MLLRRVIAHFRNQEWTAIGIDLVIVVVGVFIGIQVANWNAERETSQKAAIFTERLKADLREEAWGYQLLIEYFRDVLASADTAVNALSGKSSASNEAILIGAYRATQYKQRTRRRSTYDELISTGTIGLIRDQALRDTAMRIYNVATLDSIAREGSASRFREAFRMSIPNDVQRVLNKQCGDRYIVVGDFKGIADVIDYPCTTGLPEDVIDDAVAALRSNPILVPVLRLRIADIETRLGDLTVNNKDIVQGLNAIAEEAP